MSDTLLAVLTRYEGAVNACEVDGDDSDAAVKELEAAREGLLAVLRKALDVELNTESDTLNPRHDSKRWERVVGKAIKDWTTAIMAARKMTREKAREHVLSLIRTYTDVEQSEVASYETPRTQSGEMGQ